MFHNESFYWNINRTYFGYPDQPTSDSFTDFHIWFSHFHGYASVVVCIFGVCTNIFNITILTRKDMRTATNILLTWLAVSDILTMLPYIPFAIHVYCPPNTTPFDAPEKFSYNWAVYMLFVNNSAATTHTISNWLGVSLALFRYFQMKSTSRGNLTKLRRIRNVKLITVLVYILSIAILIPNYLLNRIISLPGPRNTTIHIGHQEFSSKDSKTENMAFVNLLIYAVVAKVLPCLLMIIFSGSLIYTVNYRHVARRRRLANTSISKAKSKQTTTTKMLLVVIVLFLITELPQGVFILVGAAVPSFYDNVYSKLGELVDFIALLNNAINFVLYCSMSQQFRSRFVEMYIFYKRTPRSVNEDITASAASRGMSLKYHGNDN